VTLNLAASHSAALSRRVGDGSRNQGVVNTMSNQSEPRPAARLEAVMSERRHLINPTYRPLGSLAQTEDAVQETYAR
jgi:hypothetical protein